MRPKERAIEGIPEREAAMAEPIVPLWKLRSDVSREGGSGGVRTRTMRTRWRCCGRTEPRERDPWRGRRHRRWSWKETDAGRWRVIIISAHSAAPPRPTRATIEAHVRPGDDEIEAPRLIERVQRQVRARGRSAVDKDPGRVFAWLQRTREVQLLALDARGRKRRVEVRSRGRLTDQVRLADPVRSR